MSKVHTADPGSNELNAELRILSERLQAAQRVGGIGIFDWQVSKPLVYWSPELHALLGIEPGSIETTPEAWTARLHEEDRERAWDHYRAAVAARRPSYEIEARIVRPDGSTRWIRVSSSIHFESGEPVRVLGAAVDIEVLKQAATAREAERHRLFTMLQQVPAIVNFLRGPDLVFEVAHPLATKAVGGRRLLGLPILEAMPEHRGQPYYDRCAACSRLASLLHSTSQWRTWSAKGAKSTTLIGSRSICRFATNRGRWKG